MRVIQLRRLAARVGIARHRRSKARCQIHTAVGIEHRLAQVMQEAVVVPLGRARDFCSAAHAASTTVRGSPKLENTPAWHWPNTSTSCARARVNAPRSASAAITCPPHSNRPSASPWLLATSKPRSCAGAGSSEWRRGTTQVGGCGEFDLALAHQHFVARLSQRAACQPEAFDRGCPGHTAPRPARGANQNEHVALHIRGRQCRQGAEHVEATNHNRAHVHSGSRRNT